MSIVLSGGQIHRDESVTVIGLARVIKSMRWQDLETVAEQLDEYRRRAAGESILRLDAQDLYDWAESEQPT